MKRPASEGVEGNLARNIPAVVLHQDGDHAWFQKEKIVKSYVLLKDAKLDSNSKLSPGEAGKQVAIQGEGPSNGDGLAAMNVPRGGARGCASGPSGPRHRQTPRDAWGTE